MRTLLLVSAACVLLSAGSASGQANIENARLEERSGADLAKTFQQLAGGAGPFWIAYAVPAHSPDWNACCSGNWAGERCGRCSLEEGKGETVGRSTDRRPIALEGSASIVVLYRVETGRVTKVRSFSDSCELDAGGRTVYWLTGVKPSASVALLKGLVSADQGSQPSRRALSEELLAISAHQGPEAINALIDLARNGSTPGLRSDALFWLAQRAGEKAAGTITDAIENDPDTKVKERAVFALSQMPKDEGVPRLITVARTNRNPRVRRQAVFWLGQSKDPRALEFFEEILLK